MPPETSATTSASSTSNMLSSTSNATTLPIWATRPIDWPPLNAKIPMTTFVKLYKAGRNAAALSIPPKSHHSRTAPTAIASPPPPSTTTTTTSNSEGGVEERSDLEGNTNNYFTGLMNRVLNPTTITPGGTSTSTTGSTTIIMGDDDWNATEDHLDQPQFKSQVLPVRAPRPNCVAAANGWIVAVVECPWTMNGAIRSQSRPHSTTTTTSSSPPPPLRLLNRWNVRRGSSSAGGGNSSIMTNSSMDILDQWIVIPPPILVQPPPPPGPNHHNNSIMMNALPTSIPQNNDRNQYFGRIAHVFVDPTGSHTIISATNGETYYVHCSSNVNPNILSSHHHHHHHHNHAGPQNNLPKVATKLVGFGMDPANPPTSCKMTGVSASSTAFRSKSLNTNENNHHTIQIGITPNSYITAVAWDKERGTEGSTKLILLGTSQGEIYEFGFTSSMAATTPTHASNNNHTNLNTANFVYDDTASIIPHRPVLLHKLVRTESGGTTADVSEMGAAVTGLHFERLRTGLMVMVSTSGRQKRTRLYTFYSPHSSSFRMVLADQQHMNLQELPGSIDFADLKYCNDHFALRTQTGIYYGTIDRSLSGPSIMSGTRSSMIIDSGILPYTTHKNGTNVIPVSLALTPHHIVTLTEQNDIHFINRVAQTLIQKERIDMTLATSVSALEESATFLGNAFGEFLMDIRRPDQIWLRKGRSLIHISSSQEDRDVWKFTLQKCLNMSIPSSTVTTTSDDPMNYTALLLPKSSPLQRFGLSDEEKAQEALFEQAKTLCTNASQKAVVTAVRAEYHLAQGRGELAAKYFAQCPPSLAPFSDTAIRLALPKLGIDDPQGYGGSWKARTSLESSNVPLISYLNDKMKIGSTNDDKMMCTMIGAWLTELFLHERGERLTSAVVNELTGTMEVESSQRAVLAQFLNANVSHMDSRTIMKILTSHDVNAVECAAFAARSGDIATAVNAALSGRLNEMNGANEALQILNSASFELAEPLYYKHASTLLSRSPVLAGESFLSRYSQGLSPMRLLPSIMRYEKNRMEQLRDHSNVDGVRTRGQLSGTEESKSFVDQSKDSSRDLTDSNVAINYLEGVVSQGCRNGAVFRYLLSLYVAMDNEESLLAFLSQHVSATSSIVDATKKAILAGDRPQLGADDPASTPLDMSYALRAVLGSGRHFRSAIKLYMGFGMRPQAVELALKVDPSLARQLAQGSIELEERKRLWLMVAKAAATDCTNSGKDVVSRVVSVLKDCGPDVLSIEDVLPFLPDFAQIDQIKDEICEALTSYSSKIEGYLKEMNDCDQACNNIRDEISRLRKHHMRVKADARCAFTQKLVLSAGEPFYAFPSGYVVLESALKQEILPYLTDSQRKRVEELEVLIQAGSSEKPIQTLQAELDSILAAECPLTGSVMLESIDKPFLVDDVEFADGFDAAVDRIDV